MQDKSTENGATHTTQRVVGALVLLALAVIFVPMVLDFSKGYERSISKTNIPPRPGDIRVETLALPGDEPVSVAGGTLPPVPPLPAKALPLEQTSAADTSATGSTASQAGNHQSAVAPESSPRPPLSLQASPIHQATPTPTKQPAKPGGVPAPVAWAVQVGSFNSAKNARALRDRLRRQGFHALVDRLTVNGKVIIRVLVGPELTKSAAVTRRRALQKKLQLLGLVVRYR